MSYEPISMTLACGEVNIPGLSNFQFLPIDWIDSFPEFRVENNSINQAVGIIAGKDWLDGISVVDELQYKEPERSSSQGESFNASLTGFVPKDTPAMNNLFNGMRSDCFIIKYTDKNGQVKLIGSPDEPLLFNSDLDTGKKSGDVSGHSFKFSGVLTQKAPFYTA